jgi:hypothetical protein
MGLLAQFRPLAIRVDCPRPIVKAKILEREFALPILKRGCRSQDKAGEVHRELVALRRAQSGTHPRNSGSETLSSFRAWRAIVARVIELRTLLILT